MANFSAKLGRQKVAIKKRIWRRVSQIFFSSSRDKMAENVTENGPFFAVLIVFLLRKVLFTGNVCSFVRSSVR